VALIAAPGAAGASLDLVVNDLDKIVGGATLESRLDLVPAPEGGWLGTHTLLRCTFTGAAPLNASELDDLNALGLPVLSSSAVKVDVDDAGDVTLDSHAFTLRLPSLWARALSDIALRPRGLMTDPSAFAAALVAGAVATGPQGTLHGCAAIEQLLCARSNAVHCAPLLSTTCQTDVVAALAASLAAPFEAQTGLDLSLDRGTAAAVDKDGDLVAEQLGTPTGQGHFQATIALPRRQVQVTIPFTGEQ
jgi:hypothetical protein